MAKPEQWDAALKAYQAGYDHLPCPICGHPFKDETKCPHWRYQVIDFLKAQLEHAQ